MLSLTLDTSTEYLLLILSQGETIIDSLTIPHCQNLSSSLIPSLQDLCHTNKVSLQQLKKLYVGVGPGSYTGTRVGVAVMTSLHLALAIPIGSFCSLLAFLPSTLSDGPFLFISEAKHTPHFLVEGTLEKGKIHQALHFHSLTTENLPTLLQKNHSLIAMNPNSLPKEIFTLSSHWIQAHPNPSPLLSYLVGKDPLLQGSLKIFYHHNL